MMTLSLPASRCPRRSSRTDQFWRLRLSTPPVRYRYVRNDPVNNIDPSGQEAYPWDRYRPRSFVYREAMQEVARDYSISFNPEDAEWANHIVKVDWRGATRSLSQLVDEVYAAKVKWYANNNRQVVSDDEFVKLVAGPVTDTEYDDMFVQRGVRDRQAGTYNQTVRGTSIGPLVFTPDPSSTPAADAAFLTAVKAAMNDAATPGVLTQAEINSIPINHAQAIAILASTGRRVVTPYSTRAFIDKTTAHPSSNSSATWDAMLKAYPGATHEQIIDLETERSNIKMAKVALAIDTNKAISGFMKVFPATASLIMMAMDLPIVIGAAFRPNISPAAAVSDTELESIVAQAKARQWVIDEHIAEEFEGVMSSLSVPGGLASQEARPALGIAGGHTLDPAKAHVGATDQQLIERATSETTAAAAKSAAKGKTVKPPPAISTFTDRPVAEQAVFHVLHERRQEIASWLASSDPKSPGLKFTVGYDAGRSLQRGAAPYYSGAPTVARTGVVVLRRDPSRAAGYYIVTSFPEAP